MRGEELFSGDDKEDKFCAPLIGKNPERYVDAGYDFKIWMEYLRIQIGHQYPIATFNQDKLQLSFSSIDRRLFVALIQDADYGVDGWLYGICTSMLNVEHYTGRVSSRTFRTTSLQSVLQDDICTQGQTLESRDSEDFGDTLLSPKASTLHGLGSRT